MRVLVCRGRDYDNRPALYAVIDSLHGERWFTVLIADGAHGDGPNWEEAAMKAVAFANNDMAVMAWTLGGKLPNCLGFAIYRIDVRAGTETCLPAMATFSGQQATPGHTTADDPVQKFFWKDVYAKRGGTYRYKIVPMAGTPGNLQPMPFGPVISNQIQLSPDLRHAIGLF
jgi:hypothetical protein